jgi:putative redox protein
LIIFKDLKMGQTIETSWAGGMAFETILDDHKLVADAHPNVGGDGKGPRPKPLLLFSLAGCTGMDVVSLLKKMRVDFEDFKMQVSGELTDEHPKYYHKIHLTYQFKGKNINASKVEKAVNISQDKYCGVSHMLKQAAEITWDIKYI